MKRVKKSQSSGGNEGGRERHIVMDVMDIKTHPTFVDLLPVSEDMLENIIQDMRVNGYYESAPVVLGKWPGQDEPVLIDGHARVRSAGEVGITHVPAVVVEFEDEAAALEHAMSLQTKRRTTTDGALYRLCDRRDRLMERGGDRRSEEARSKMPHGNVGSQESSSALRTASFIGCNYRKVDRIRKIRKDGTPEIQRAVRTDKMSINRAYNLIREMEKKKERGEDSSSAEQNKPVKIRFSAENFAVLQELGGDVTAHVNKAIEMYIGWLRDKESDHGGPP